MENKDYIYEIRNLNCSYDRKRIVLHIEDLCIPKKNIVFIVGRSGIGKSTILETLGFMNNTIEGVNKEDEVTFMYNGSSVYNVWHKCKNSAVPKLSELRKNFSFIFQQDNLMPNFSAKQNVMITAMLQGKTYKTAEEEADKIIRKLWKDEIENGKELYETTKTFQQNSKLSNVKDRPISEWSGGEKQRLAFARAIIPNFSVLFGDEPTGNLDEKTADCLMSVLKNSVIDKEATAIIVSHDIRLSVKYADRIVFIQSEQNGGGCINNRSIYVYEEDCQKWVCAGNKIENIYDELRIRLQ